MIDIAYYLNLVKNTPFPFPRYSDKSLQRSYKELQKRVVLQSNTGLDIVKHLHPSIWRCNLHGHVSPIVAWHDDITMMRVILNRAKYLNTEVLSPQNLLTGLSVTKLAPKVSIFRPMTAKYLINKYLSDSKTIFDPCAGFSGRMLGTCVLGKRYIGQDINSTTIREAKELRDYFKLDAELRVKDSLYDTGEYEALFTCPPYGDKECWYQDIEVFSADEWITTCLKNYKCKAYLFVVDKTDLYKDFIAEELPNKSHFGSSTESVVFIKGD